MSDGIPTHRMMEAFRAAILNGGITAAADALGMSQPSVSRVIADLQKVVGFPLFVKQGRSVKPTEEAIALMTKVQMSFLGLEEISRFAEQLRKQRMGRLSICAIPAIGHSIMPEIVDQLRSKYPNVVVSLTILSHVEVARRVRDRQADVGFAAQGLAYGETDSIGEFSSACVCIGGPKWLPGKGKSVGLKQLTGKPFVALTGAIQRRLEELLSTAGHELDIVAEASLSLSASQLVLRGLGISVVDPFTGEMHRQSGGITLPLHPSLPYTVQAMAMGDTRLSEPARELIRCVGNATRKVNIHAISE